MTPSDPNDVPKARLEIPLNVRPQGICLSLLPSESPPDLFMLPPKCLLFMAERLHLSLYEHDTHHAGYS